VHLIRRLNKIIPKTLKKRFLLLVPIIAIGAFMEMFSISLILPFINIILDASYLETSDPLLFIYNLLGFESVNQFYIFFAGSLILFYLIKAIYLVSMYRVQYKAVFNGYALFSKNNLRLYLEKPYSFYLNHNTANLIRNVNIESNKVFNGVILNLMHFVTEIAVALALISYLLYLEFKITSILMIIIGVVLYITIRITRRLSEKHGKEYQRNNGLMIKWTNQAFGVIKEMKIFRREDYFASRYGETSKKYSEARRKQSLIAQLPRIVIEFCGMAALLGLILVMLISGQNTAELFGTLTAFAVATIRLLPSINRISASYNRIIFNKSAVDVIYKDLYSVKVDVYKNSAKENDEKESFSFNTDINLKDISFKYEKAESFIFESLNLEIKKGTAIGIIGTTGGGKTTLIDILMGILAPTSGDVLCDSESILQNTDAWVMNISYVPQEIRLIDDSIKRNIAFGLPDDKIDMEHLKHVAQKARLDEYINTLSNGYDTEIGERGVRISGGQRQRIGIARALYTNPKILVMDEGTSSLDNETEKEIVSSIESLHDEVTMVVVAHRLSTIKKCDAVYTLDNGKLNLTNKLD